LKLKKGQHLDLVLLAIVLLAAFLNIYNIWKDIYANAYYTAAVTSMLQSFHNFFFASFDPAGFISVDKPPVVFWVQTLFAYLFGVHGWSIVLPQALAGIGSVLLIYHLVKPTFGRNAARCASLVMALTPVAVAVSRTNNIDSLLVFTLLLATTLLFKGVRRQQAGWVLGGFALVGLAFNMKMLQAYLIVPACYLFYLIAFKCNWKKKLGILLLATVLLAGISLSWALAVDLTPQANRPYVGGSTNNSVLQLAFGYNGISRLTGMQGNGGGKAPAINNRSNINRDKRFVPPQGFNPNKLRQGQRTTFNGNQPANNGGGGSFNTGTAGPLRLFQSQLSGQASWMLIFALIACVSLLAGVRRKKALTGKESETIFWLSWLLAEMVFFSVADFYHQYYLIMLAPPIAALSGTGLVEMWHSYRERTGWRSWLLPVAMLATTAFQVYILLPYQSQIGIGWPIGVGVAGTAAVVALILLRQREKLSRMAVLVGLLAMLAAPLFWSATPLLYGDNAMMPAAGPSNGGIGRTTAMSGGGNRSETNTRLISYLTSHNNGEKYFFATTDSNTAAPYIIATGKAVMAMGGFSGSDSALTLAQLQLMVQQKQVKYFLISSGSDGRAGSGNSQILAWVRSHSTQVPTSAWQSGSTQGGQMGMGGSNLLYQINQ